MASVLGGVLASGAARAVDLPEDQADAMYHLYDGGGVRASGPALLLRKIAGPVSITGTYYVDMVSNASIDVVTTASPYKETRNAYALGVDYVYQDSLLTVAGGTSREPDYTANFVNFDVSQDVFYGLTTVNLGFTRGSDDVRKTGDPGFSETATHWRYRLGMTQIVTPRLMMSANLEAISDDGFLGSPYRVARVFGAAVPERVPSTRTSRAVKLRAIGDIGEGETRSSLRGEYRYFWDTWGITAHTVGASYLRYLGNAWLAEASVRYYTQKAALFYSDNASSETDYVTRNRQLGTFNSAAAGASLAYTVKQVPGKYAVTLNASYEFISFKYSDFTDIRTGNLYSFNANIAQLFVSANF